MRALRIVMAVVITVFVGIGSVFAGSQESGNEGKGAHGGRGFLNVLEKLALSADQEKEIASILTRHRDEIGKTVSGMVAAKQGLREAMTADGFSESVVRQAAQRVSEQEVQAAVLRARIADEIKPVLSAEQRDKLKMLANRRTDKAKSAFDAWVANLDEWIAGHAR